MTYQHPTAWIDPRTRDHPAREARRNQARNGRALPKRLPSLYPFPIDFLCDERLLVMLGVLVREVGLSEAQARVAAALLAGYTSEIYIAERLTISRHTVHRHMQDIRKKLGIKGERAFSGLHAAVVVARLWRYYRPLRPQILLLPRLDPALLELEPRHEHADQAAD